MSKLPIVFETYDKLQLKPFAKDLENFCKHEHGYVNGSLVIALNAPYGHGKSTFLEMWKNDLEERLASDPDLPCPVILNAWESDHCSDPLVAILVALIDCVDKFRGPDAPKKKEKIREVAADTAWILAGAANGVVAKFTGIDLQKANDLANSKRSSNFSSIDLLQEHKKRIEALHELKSVLRQEIGNEGTPKIILMVDELDRCRPDYAISYLETMKHVFDIPGIVFILAIDEKHLANSAKSLFGKNLNCAEYFRKFWSASVSLPERRESERRTLIENAFKTFISIEGKRITLLENNSYDIQRCEELADALDLTSRQIEDALRYAGRAMATDDPSKAGRVIWPLGALTLLLCFIKTGRPELYDNIKKQKKEAEIAICEQLVSMDKTSLEWWLTLVAGSSIDSYAFGSASTSEYMDHLRQFTKIIGVSTEQEENNFKNRLSTVLSGWNYGARGIIRAIERIELSPPRNSRR